MIADHDNHHYHDNHHHHENHTDDNSIRRSEDIARSVKIILTIMFDAFFALCALQHSHIAK